MTSFRFVEGIEPYRVCVIFGFGKPNPILLIQDEKGRSDIAVFSVSDMPVRVWGEEIDSELAVIQFILTHQAALIDHWNGNNDSVDLCRIIQERRLSPIRSFINNLKKLPAEKVDLSRTLRS